VTDPGSFQFIHKSAFPVYGEGTTPSKPSQISVSTVTRPSCQSYWVVPKLDCGLYRRFWILKKAGGKNAHACIESCSFPKGW